MDTMLALQATSSRLRVRRSASLEATARGAGTLAMLGAGVVDSLEELSEQWKFTYEVEPADPLDADRNYDVWLRAVQRA